MYKNETTIINSPNAFEDIVIFLKKYFDDVKVVKNKYSHLAHKTQNCYILIIFKNRGETFTIQWNYAYCTLRLGNWHENEYIPLRYTFTKMEFDYLYPCEVGNNGNVTFWTTEITEDLSGYFKKIGELRMPVFVEKDKVKLKENLKPYWGYKSNKRCNINKLR